MFDKLKQAQDDRFDNTYFKQLCEDKKQLEIRINATTNNQLQDVLEQKLRWIDAELNLIVVEEKKAQGMDYYGDKAKRYERNNKAAFKSEKNRVNPIFVNGEMI